MPYPVSRRPPRGYKVPFVEEQTGHHLTGDVGGPGKARWEQKVIPGRKNRGVPERLQFGIGPYGRVTGDVVPSIFESP